MQFKDKVIWITGASSGYGAEMAKALAQAEAKLILSARRTDKLTELAKTLQHAQTLPLDLADFNSFKDKTQQAIAAFGHIDMIIHNGALAQNAAVLETSLEVERQIMDVDYFSYTELTRCLLPHMLQRGHGQIVVVSGLLAHLSLPGRSSYAAAKAALIGYFGCLRAELVDKNIQITVLIPGSMQTGLANKAIRADGQPNNTSTSSEVLSSIGCPLEQATEQSLAAIAQHRTLAYIGLEDKYYQLWKLTLSDPEQGIKMLLEQLQSSH